jgi:hypothetical protein
MHKREFHYRFDACMRLRTAGPCGNRGRPKGQPKTRGARRGGSPAGCSPASTCAPRSGPGRRERKVCGSFPRQVRRRPRRSGASTEPPFRHDVVRAGLMPMSKRGPRRDRKQFPYEAQVVGGKLLMPADLQRLHRFMLETEVIEAISEEMRSVVERLWPELVSKLPAGTCGA